MKNNKMTANEFIHTHQNILYIQSNSNYSKIFFIDNKKYVVAKVLKWFDEQLRTMSFIRVSNKSLLNTNYIIHFNSKFVQMNDGSILKISRRKRKAVCDYLENKK